MITGEPYSSVQPVARLLPLSFFLSLSKGGVTTPLLKLQARSNHSAISKSD